ncbi:TetR family transcriptional regulator [Kineosporia mesophila]|uniref:TetR family transcriptional regulator n=1 Tax=Kineosporia mesophila TaxID=566012 RepID=UPI001E388BD3|nr:TetR family transcriptional regulator [Kineosporia mesophila]
MPELPTSPKGAATSRRILDAALQEFAERGIAGARVDRITAAARTNKAQVYGYFGNKDGLFDAVLTDVLERTATAVHFDADDLPGWAVAVYDENLNSPHVVRLLTWARLERRESGRLEIAPDVEPKLAAIARAQNEGRLRAGEPADLLLLVLGAASAWSPAGGSYAASADEPATEHTRRRAALHDFIQQAIAP